MSATAVRTRFAPSPTGFLHIGGARTALFSWAYARHFGGTFILRIEDTDVERSTPQAVQGILDGMHWLGLAHDEGPFFQMQRMDRYREVIASMLEAGTAYHCWATPAELDAMREAQRAAGAKPRYDGRWRPENRALRGLVAPADLKPVVRFRNPDDGEVAWNDLVKGPIAFSNAELDDLIIARSDGTPTYNFCVVVDDWDMQITHVIRGDDHVNNTPRQINIFQALGKEPPVYAHLPTVLNEQGEKMSKRNGAKAVTAYRDEGYLPDAMVNYLARLGWSHGDDEIFSRAQFLEWFNLDHLGRSAAQFDEAKLKWVNAQHLKAMSDEALVQHVQPFLAKLSVVSDERLASICGLFKDRCDTLVVLAQWISAFYLDVVPNPEEKAQHVTDAVKPALALLAEKLSACAWDKASISAKIKETLTETGLKMPLLAMPVRVLVMGTAQTPSLDAVLALSQREKILERLKNA
jgi:glutamyl-tRNA synthetase